MDQPTANKLDRLLADGELSGPEADAIFERVHSAVVRTERRRRVRAVTWLAASIAAAAAIGLVLVEPAPDPRAELTARGSVADASVLEAVCSQGTLAACPMSSTLTFAIRGSSPAGFLSAYAEPLDAPAERIWYFSSDTASPELAGAVDETRVFDRGVRLSGTHRPGRYRIHAFLADRPLSPAEMVASPDAGQVRASMQSDLSVTE